jgi:molybdate transport system substrate-binding protein
MTERRFDRGNRVWHTLLAVITALSTSVAGACAESITVLGAASLQDALVDVAVQYEKVHPGIHVEFSFAGTATLRAQVENGAAFDVFVAADTLHPNALFEQNLIRAPHVFAHNRLVLVTRKGWIVPPAVLDAAATLHSGASGSPGAGAGDSPVSPTGALRHLGPEGRSQTMLESLRRPGARVVVGDEAVPVGRYTRAALDRMSADPKLGAGFRDAVERHVVSLESNVRWVLAKVILGEADAGFVYATDVRAEEDRVYVTPIPDAWNVTAALAVAVAERSRERKGAEAFVAFLVSQQGQALMRRHRFLE